MLGDHQDILGLSVEAVAAILALDKGGKRSSDSQLSVLHKIVEANQI